VRFYQASSSELNGLVQETPQRETGSSELGMARSGAVGAVA
jgi:GDP-D-mannose dehydratase